MQWTAMWAAALSVLSVNSSASQNSSSNSQTVDVYFHSEVNLTPSVEVGAKGHAVKRFAEIGVRINWHKGLPAGPDAGSGAVIVTVVASPPAEMQGPAYATVLATARPYASGATCITVYYDRVAAVMRQYEGKGPIFFGHVLAHELGHVLQGIARHSGSGLMRGSWTLGDRAEMMRHGLPFAPEDAELIHFGILARERSVTRSALARLPARGSLPKCVAEYPGCMPDNAGPE